MSKLVVPILLPLIIFVALITTLVTICLAEPFVSGYLIEKIPDHNDELSLNNIYLQHDKNLILNNTIERFMGFIGIISPAPVVNYKSKKNTQLAKISRCVKKKDIANFTMRCDFEFTGLGYFVSIFNKDKVIENTIRALGKKTTKKKLIKEMSVQNGGLGFIEVEGTIDKDIETVEKVMVNFSGRGVESPVKITLFDAQFNEGTYVKRDDEPLVSATVKSLTFKRRYDTGKPKMEIRLESIGESNTLLGITSAFIANNFIIEPITITEKGNALMLDFGDALLQNKQFFSFR